ncbi:MAG: hypothetical protein AB1635_10410 [Acidobacteriota bacterium]
MNSSQAARVLGRRGGRVRARRLSADRRRQIASMGGAARRESIAAARRVADNFLYAAMMEALRGAPHTIERLSECPEPLPALRGRPAR